MGLNDFWSTSQRANDFLRTGSFNDTVRNEGSNTGSWSRNVGGGGNNNSLSTGSGCTGSSQCPSGWACVDGICQQMGSGGNQQQYSPGGGDCDPDDPESPCNSGGPGACQQTPGCGDDSEARDCCGERCCSFGSASSSRPGVNCFCGPCPPWPGCTSFCSSYLKANGVPGPGCTEGRDGNSCDACTECDGNVGGECQPLSIGAPCWCEGEECNGDACQKCETDPESSDYGECSLDAANCQDCATITNYLCPCNVTLPPVTVCKPYGAGGLLAINLAQQEAARQCQEVCAARPDPCAPECTNHTRCTDIGTGVAACLEGETQTGTLEVGGETCVFCEKCDISNLPDSCKECDCNCHLDCPECTFCNASGQCEQDPACDECTAPGAGLDCWETATGATANLQVSTDGGNDWNDTGIRAVKILSSETTESYPDGTFFWVTTYQNFDGSVGSFNVRYSEMRVRLETTDCGGTRPCEPPPCMNPDFDYGLGTYTFTYTSRFFTGETRSCFGNTLLGEAEDRLLPTQESVYNNIYGMKLMNYGVVSFIKNCGPVLDTSGFTNNAVVWELYIQHQQNGPYTLALQSTSGEGVLIDTREYYTSPRGRELVDYNIQFNGSDVTPSGCL